MLGSARNAIVDGRNLRHAFGPKRIFHDLSFALAEGKKLALVGPNGSGKSTLLRCIAGTLKPDDGLIVIDGARAGSIEAREKVGVASALERAFYLRLSGWENLLLFSRIRYPTARTASAEAKDLVEELQIDHIVKERADRCSSGMLQQLAFARALLGHPKLLLLDEPTRSLDDGAKSRFWDALSRRPGVSVILATHSEHDAEGCDERMVLEPSATQS